MSATIYTVETLGLAAGSGPSELLLLGFGLGTAPPPVAGFTGSPVSGFAPLTVSYTNTSSGSITSLVFDPGDGSGTVTVFPSSHTYSVGTYSPSLTVTGPGGSNELLLPNYITVTSPPPPIVGPVIAAKWSVPTLVATWSVPSLTAKWSVPALVASWSI